MRSTVLTDASYCPRQKVGGWAAWVRIDGLLKPVGRCGIIQDRNMPDSNTAEMYAALNGLWLARTLGATRFLLRTDCMAVVHAVQFKLNNERLKGIWSQGMRTIQVRPGDVQPRHVKGHQTGDLDRAGWVNNWCDKHAKEQMQRARGGHTK